MHYAGLLTVLSLTIFVYFLKRDVLIYTLSEEETNSTTMKLGNG